MKENRNYFTNIRTKVHEHLVWKIRNKLSFSKDEKESSFYKQASGVKKFSRTGVPSRLVAGVGECFFAYHSNSWLS